MAMVVRNTGGRGRASSSRGRNTGSTSRSRGSKSMSRTGRSTAGLSADSFTSELTEVSIDDRVDYLQGRRLDSRNKGVGRNNDQGYIDREANKYQTSAAHMQKFLNSDRHNIANIVNRDNKSDMTAEYDKHKNKATSVSKHLTNVRRRSNLEYLFEKGSNYNSQYVQSIVIDEQIHKSKDLNFHFYDTYSEIAKKVEQRSMLSNMTLHDWIVQAVTGAILPDVDNFKTFEPYGAKNKNTSFMAFVL